MERDVTNTTLSVVWTLIPILLWIVFWFLCVNWKKAWPILAQGGWFPVVLLIFMATLVWSLLIPESFLNVRNFWWQLTAVCIWTAVALICGWLQVVAGYSPPEIAVEPPPAAHGHGHGHDHHGNHHAGHH